ncbi:MAG TPA: STAS domain-containing protein [Solirubrobacterales bacterium]|nr:STAS domain-containing protein [Solirubrobacterales bacterium]
MPPAPFETSSADVDGVRVVAVRGELDLSTAPDLEGPLEEALAGGEASVLIDLTECEFIDSTGIAMIVRAWQQVDGADEHGGHLVISSSNEQVQRVLEISGLNLSIPIHASREAGLAALRNNSSPDSA